MNGQRNRNAEHGEKMQKKGKKKGRYKLTRNRFKRLLLNQIEVEYWVCHCELEKSDVEHLFGEQETEAERSFK